MDIKEILKKEFVGQKFRDNNKIVWEVVSRGYRDRKQTLILKSRLDFLKDDGNDYIGYEIGKLMQLSDIVNLRFEKVENKR